MEATTVTTPARTGVAGARELDAALRYAVAAALLALLAARIDLGVGLSVGLVAAVFTLPLWFSAARRYRGGSAVLTLGAASVVSGVWLTQVAAASHVTSSQDLASNVALLATLLVTVAVVLWARQFMDVRHIGAWYALGMLAYEATSTGRLSSNPWKFAYAIPIAFVLLSLAHRWRTTTAQLAALGALGLVSATQDSRSYFGTFLLAALLLLWQARPVGRRRANVAVTGVLVAGATWLVFQTGQSLLLSGALGSDAQARSVEQLDASGSVLLGGRPELAASLALLRYHPWGFGAGTVPSPQDVLAAKSGMAAINYQPNNGYVEKYMFGGHFKLHSVTFDLWANFGIVGLAFAFVAIGAVVLSALQLLSVRRMSGLLAFLVVFTMWNALFSPLFGSTLTLGFTIGLALVPRAAPDEAVERP